MRTNGSARTSLPCREYARYVATYEPFCMERCHYFNIPFISEIVLQTDNAKSYSNNFLLCGISLLNFVYKHKSISIVEFLHTETQDGKTILDAFFARCMKFVKEYMAVIDTNKVKRIGTAEELGKALSHNGGMRNTMIQVVATNKDHTSKIEKKFEDVIKGFSKYFSRVNHVYFTRCDSIGPSYDELSDRVPSDDTCLDIINHLTFDVGVQSFSNIDKIVNFHIDMSKSKSKQIEPEQSVLDEIQHIMSSIGNSGNSNDTSTCDTTTPATTADTSTLDLDETHNAAVAGLLDLGVGVVTLDDEYYCEQQHSNIDGQQRDMQTNNLNEDCTDIDDDDSLYEDEDESVDGDINDDYSLNDLDEETVNRSKRKLEMVNGQLYPINSFITRVEIQMMLSIDNINLTSFDHINRSRTKRNIRFKGNSAKTDVRSNAIRFSNDHIQNGDLSVLSSAKDNPVLDDSVGYCIDNSVLSTFDQGWGRRINKIGTSTNTLYGDTYIDPYKDKLREFFERGARNSSKKMNAAMMRTELRKLYPDVFSIPGETEIKKYISQLFMKSKSNIDDRDNEVDLILNEDIDNESEITTRVNWEKILKEMVEDNPSEKPNLIYDNFIAKFDDMQQQQLPPKKDVKKKISSLKAVVRRRVQRSIV